MPLTPCEPCNCVPGVIPNDTFKQDVEVILCNILTVLIEGGGSITLNPPLNKTTTAYANSLSIKAAAGTLYLLTGYNSGPDQFIQIHDSAGLPANGAIPKVSFKVLSGHNFSYDPEIRGRGFANGIYVVNSSTQPTKTIGATDCWFDAQYI